MLDAPSSIVPNQQADAVALIDLLEARERQAGRKATGAAAATIDGLRLGIRHAPPGVIVYHERLQLLQLFDAIDLLGDALAPPPEPASPAEPEPEPEPPADDGN